MDCLTVKEDLSQRMESTMKEMWRKDRQTDMENPLIIWKGIPTKGNGMKISLRGKANKCGLVFLSLKESSGEESSKEKESTKDWDNISMRDNF